MDKCNIYNCNIYVAQKYVKHKWIPIIMFLLNKYKSITFTELLNNIEFISNKRLSESLNILTNNKIIVKDENNKYLLSDQGEKLAQIILLMSQFDGEYN